MTAKQTVAAKIVLHSADFRSGAITVQHGDGHTMRLSVGELDAAAQQGDAELAAIYRDLHARAVREIEAARRTSVHACAGHSAITSRDIPYDGSGDYGPAQGNITVVEECRCGAERRTHVNQRHVDEGRWS